ncbi:hypothetical protein HDV05_007090, partial [Chytridiales sp. JEL 0842]
MDDKIITNLRASVKALEEKVKEKESEIEELKKSTRYRKLADYEAEIQKYYLETIKLRRDLEHKTAGAKILEDDPNELLRYDDAIEEFNAKLESAMNENCELRDIKEQLELAQFKIKAKEREIDSMNEVQQGLRGEIESLEKNVTSLTSTKVSLESQIENLKKEQEDKETQLKSQISELKSIKEDLDRAIEKQLDENSKLQRELDDMKVQYKKEHEVVVDLQEQLGMGLGTIESLEKQSTENENSLKAAIELNSSLDAELQDLKVKYSIRNREFNESEERQRLMEADIENYVEQQKVLERELEESRSRNKALEGEITNNHIRFTALESELDVLKRHLTLHSLEYPKAPESTFSGPTESISPDASASVAGAAVAEREQTATQANNSQVKSNPDLPPIVNQTNRSGQLSKQASSVFSRASTPAPAESEEDSVLKVDQPLPLPTRQRRLSKSMVLTNIPPTPTMKNSSSADNIHQRGRQLSRPAVDGKDSPTKKESLKKKSSSRSRSGSIKHSRKASVGSKGSVSKPTEASKPASRSASISRQVSKRSSSKTPSIASRAPSVTRVPSDSKPASGKASASASKRNSVTKTAPLSKSSSASSIHASEVASTTLDSVTKSESTHASSSNTVVNLRGKLAPLENVPRPTLPDKPAEVPENATTEGVPVAAASAQEVGIESFKVSWPAPEPHAALNPSPSFSIGIAKQVSDAPISAAQELVANNEMVSSGPATTPVDANTELGATNRKSDIGEEGSVPLEQQPIVERAELLAERTSPAPVDAPASAVLNSQVLAQSQFPSSSEVTAGINDDIECNNTGTTSLQGETPTRSLQFLPRQPIETSRRNSAANISASAHVDNGETGSVIKTDQTRSSTSSQPANSGSQYVLARQSVSESTKESENTSEPAPEKTSEPTSAGNDSTSDVVLLSENADSESDEDAPTPTEKEWKPRPIEESLKASQPIVADSDDKKEKAHEEAFEIHSVKPAISMSTTI